jgi:hypothetical protein
MQAQPRPDPIHDELSDDVKNDLARVFAYLKKVYAEKTVTLAEIQDRRRRHRSWWEAGGYGLYDD